MDRISTLSAFARLVELGSFSAVAAELRVSQSTVSKWIAQLEQELGVRLLDRTTRSVRVTESGQQLYRSATAIVSAYDEAVAEVRQDAAVLRGRIRMSVPVVFGRRFIVPAVAEFLQQHPAIELDLSFGDRYVSLVEEGFDLVVRVGVPVDSTLQSHALATGRRYLVAAPDYLEAHGVPRTPANLESHQCLVHTERSTRAAWSFERKGTSQRVRVGGRVTANNSESTLHMARAGLGVALLASWLVEDDLARGTLVPLLPRYALPSAPIRALTAPGRLLPPKVRVLIDHLREAIITGLGSNAKGSPK